jgi:serine/threonine protein kinase
MLPSVPLSPLAFDQSPYMRSLQLAAWPQGSQPSDPQLIALDITEECMDLLMKLLQRDPKTRYRMGQVLHHPWFLSGLPPGAMSMNTRCLRPVVT